MTWLRPVCLGARRPEVAGVVGAEYDPANTRASGEGGRCVG